MASIFKKDLCNLWRQQHVDTKRTAGLHGIGKKNVNIGNLMYVKTQRKRSVLNKDVNTCINIDTSSVPRNLRFPNYSSRKPDILPRTCETL